MVESASEIGHVFVEITERVAVRVIFQWIFGEGNFEVTEGDITFEAKLRGGTIEFSDGDGIVENIAEASGRRAGLGAMLRLVLRQLEVVALAWPEHHAVLAES